MTNKPVQISEDLFIKLDQMATQRGVTVDQLVQEMLGDSLKAAGAVYQDHDEAKIKERLKSLGYID
ncbi:MAG: hypothetical protein COW24_03770 [Candidatus Kerfeldbacteria bacterium CG15_BIG_FIL_POST_REV_8_21_14_020_45_12]|uniref:Uncharacterized protein n=1 Tax=Candidatus Kerfeldbacteria bacterium CG15_BIG_FIL_POST_REV_8_21_14_020_45_12 TaxID=2014247 RepID=A0A2M7H3H1_9BACT|nr:MAG: hypothetical protein COW24_03770 [Candidatus Kerfeldbacteria bacterium CG15_BIG_FIL_POST_REV_8_21_14_020_45_12]PJA93818.1 MAG: hypothetical protein CO132_01375 [Candidatus Kerfeldbacteria bacterium CG_4_9_14_3_um_filter_45_8]